MRVQREVGRPLPHVAPAGVVGQAEHLVAVLAEIVQSLVGGDGLAAAAVPVEYDGVITAQ